MSTTAHPADMPASIAQQLGQLRDRLVSDLRGEAAAVDGLVTEAASDLMPARVHDFLPLLVERRVRDRLRQANGQR